MKMKIYMPVLLMSFVFVTSLSCGGGPRRGSIKEVDDSTSVSTGILPQTPKKFNFYLENSASMDGYISGNTDFEIALTTLLVKLKYNYGADKINLNFINTKVYPSKTKEVELFAKALEPNSIDYQRGARGSSNLNNIIKDLLEATAEDEVCVFISDCIYSIGKEGNTESLLSYQQSLTMDAYLTKLTSVDLSTLVLRLNSDFNGLYYDKTDTSTKLSADERRPYYIWVIARSNEMKDVLDKVPFEELKGLESQLYFTGKGANAVSPTYSLLLDTDVIGRFSPPRNSDSALATGLKGIKKDTRNTEVEFGFKVALDLKGLSVNRNYLLNKDNYHAGNGFEVVSVEKYSSSELSNSDANRLNNESFTHILTLQAREFRQIKNGTIDITLSPRFDLWTDHYSTTDDSQIKNTLHKTFGLSYLISGVIQAYDEVLNNEPVQFMKLEIPISR